MNQAEPNVELAKTTAAIAEMTLMALRCSRKDQELKERGKEAIRHLHKHFSEEFLEATFRGFRDDPQTTMHRLRVEATRLSGEAFAKYGHSMGRAVAAELDQEIDRLWFVLGTSRR